MTLFLFFPPPHPILSSPLFLLNPAICHSLSTPQPPPPNTSLLFSNSEPLSSPPTLLLQPISSFPVYSLHPSPHCCKLIPCTLSNQVCPGFDCARSSQTPPTTIPPIGQHLFSRFCVFLIAVSCFQPLASYQAKWWTAGTRTSMFL